MKKILYTKKEIINALNQEIETFEERYKNSEELGDEISGKYYSVISELTRLRDYVLSK